MSCLICESLEQEYLARLGEYVEARTSAGFRVSTKLAAQINVEMERARYELEEHRSECASAVRMPVRLPQREMPARELPATLQPLAA
jgi:hypothetical protein